MNRHRLGASLGALVLLALAAAPTHAIFHLWDIKEIYSNHDGSVQFIELFTTSGFEQFVAGQQIRAISDGVERTFTFGSNLSGSTANRHLLIATPGFSGLAGGVAANFSLPNPVPSPGVVTPFFNPNATSITINFVGADAPLSFAGSLLPKDGVHSLTDANPNGTPALSVSVNSPTNFAGAAGSVNLPPPPPPPTGDYNGDGTVDAGDYVYWRNRLGEMVDIHGTGADGDADGMIDIDDYTFWKERYGDIVDEQGSGGTTAPEPGMIPATLLVLSLAAGTRWRRPGRRRS